MPENYSRLLLNLAFQLVGVTIGVVLSVTWALGAYEARFENQVATTQAQGVRIDTLEHNEEGVGTVLTAHTSQLMHLEKDAGALKSSLQRSEDKIENSLTELKFDMKERQDLIIRLIEAGNHSHK